MSGAITSARILAVDDQPENLWVLETVLRSAGYTRLVSTTDPREVERLFVEDPPDLVLLDLNMPHRDGFEVLEWIRAQTPPDEYLPVVILSADGRPESRLRALGCGAQDFLLKPFRGAEFLGRVHHLLQVRFGRRTAAR